MSEPSQPTPPVPPQPPAPPVPPVPPVPRYGEYAPEGYVSPVPQPAPPVYGEQPTGQPQYAQPQYAQPQYTQPYGAGSYPAQPGVRRRKTWDVVLTSILLALGLIGMLIGIGYAALFSDPALLDDAFQQQGLGGFNGSVGAAPGIIVGSHIVLYLLALGGSIPLLLTKRVAFWVPLAAGVIAAIFFWGALLSVFLSDPNFVSTYS